MILTVVGLVACPHALAVGDDARDAKVATALQTAFAKNIAHARFWLAAKDYKSLAQSAGSLEILAEVARSQSDAAAWQAAAKRVVSATQGLRAAAQREEGNSAEAALQDLDDAQAEWAKLSPTGQPLLPPKVNLRSAMYLMDGVRGDAKVALIAGNVDSAKNQAYVLSELGRVVSNLRSGERWARLAGDFTDASLAAARSPAADPAELRPLLKAISQRCDACHENR